MYVTGRSLLERFQKAILMKARHSALHAEYSAEFQEEDIAAWSLAISVWEQDRTKPNPFKDTESRMSSCSRSHTVLIPIS